MARIRSQLARIGRRATWRAAGQRSWNGTYAWDLDNLPFVIGFYATVSSLVGILALADAGTRSLGWFAVAEAAAVFLGLVWLLWERRGCEASGRTWTTSSARGRTFSATRSQRPCSSQPRAECWSRSPS